MKAMFLRNATPDLWASIGTAALLIFFFSPVWARGLIFLSDGQYGAFFAPLSLWSNAWIGGWPAGADTASFVWYPMRLAMLWSGLGFDAFVVSAYVIAALGVYAYLRIVDVSHLGGILGGMGFALCGFMVAHLGHTSMIQASAWVPWMFAAVEGCMQRNQRRWSAAGAIAVAMSLLAGHMQLAFYGIFFVSAYMAWRFWFCWRQHRMRAWLLAIAGLIVGILVAAPQLLITAAYVAQTPRAAMDYASFVGYSLPIPQLSTILFPYLFGGGEQTGTYYFGAWNFPETACYIPFLSFALAIPGLLLFRRDIAVFWGLMALAALLLALGGGVPPLADIFYRLPGFNMFRAPSRHAMEFGLAMSILSGLGADSLVKLRSRRSLAWFVAAAGGLALVAICLSIPSHAIAEGIARKANIVIRPWSGDPAIWSGVIGIAAGTFALAALASRKRHALALFALCALVGMLAFAWNAEWRRTSRTMLAESAFENDLSRRLHEGGGRLMYADPLWMTTSSAERSRTLDLPSVNWYGPLIPLRAAGLLQEDTSGAISPQVLHAENTVLDVYGVRFVALVDGRSERNVAMHASMQLPRWQPLKREGSISVYENSRALPLAWLCPVWREASGEETLDTLQESAGFDPRQQALVSGVASGGRPDADAGKVDAKWRANGVIHADIDSPDGGFLVVSVNNIEGWSATVDGVSQTIYNADYALVGLPVAKGRHRVVLEYRVPIWKWAAPWSGALSGLFAIAWLGRRQRGMEGSSAS